MSLTALQLSEKVLEETLQFMSPSEIWEYATEKGYDCSSNLHGKTPWSTIGAQIYTDIQKNGCDSIFVKSSAHKQKFGLKKIDYSNPDRAASPEDAIMKSKVSERDLHPLLVAYVNSNNHFHGHTRTIHHESSRKSTKNAEKWMHPDLVAVCLPFDDLSQQSITLAKNSGIDTITIFSFEMKQEIVGSNVREYYFQAVSNSSWANEGYLVAPKISEDAMDQLSRLNSSFGIGVIKLNLDDVYQSEVVLPSRFSDLDIGMIDNLSSINEDFRKFVISVNDSMQVGHFVGEGYDHVMDNTELEDYLKKKFSISERK